MNLTCSMTKEHHAELLALKSQLELFLRELVSVENKIHNARDEMDEAAGEIDDQKHSLRSVLDTLNKTKFKYEEGETELQKLVRTSGLSAEELNRIVGGE